MRLICVVLCHFLIKENPWECQWRVKEDLNIFWISRWIMTMSWNFLEEESILGGFSIYGLNHLASCQKILPRDLSKIVTRSECAIQKTKKQKICSCWETRELLVSVSLLVLALVSLLWIKHENKLKETIDSSTKKKYNKRMKCVYIENLNTPLCELLQKLSHKDSMKWWSELN